MTDHGYGTPATIKAEFGGLACEIVGRAYGANTVDIRLPDGHVVLNMPADMVEPVKAEKPQAWARQAMEARAR